VIVQDFDGYEQLTSIEGAGTRTASVLPPAIGNVGDFASADKLAAYFGIVPRVLQSNDTEIQGRITKRGNALVRTTLVQCTLIATARKLLTIIYDALKKRMGVQRLRRL
jgi:transposase